MDIDLKLQNKLHGPMHYKIGVTCVFIGYEILYPVVNIRQSNPPISKLSRQ